MSTQATLEEPIALPATKQFYEFAYEAVPGDESPLPPKIEVVGPPSLTALVTDPQADVLLTLTQQGLPKGTQVFFDEKDPIAWHPFDQPGQTIPKPDWITYVEVRAERIDFTIDNPAHGLHPVVVGFTPNIQWTDGLQTWALVVPDPTIINIDPTGG